MPEVNWKELPYVLNTEFIFGKHSDRPEGYGSIEIRPPFGIASCRAAYSWDGIRFTAEKEWFGAPDNPHLLVFRQTIEAFADCEFVLTASLEKPDADSAWNVLEVIETEENACGYLLMNRDGRRAALCETTLVTAFSIHVDEKRQGTDRTYAVTAFEEAPVKLERYAAFYTDETADYQEKAFFECSNASKVRFDNIKGLGAWGYDLR